jgi:hypothetical protein
MSFENLWLLLLLLLPAGWVAWEWTRQPRRASLVLKALMAVAVILALASPSYTWRDSSVALAVLADTSASLSDADLARENQLLDRIRRAKGSNQLQIIPFARTPRQLSDAEARGKLDRTTGAAGRATNLEAPIRQALASLPAGLIHRIVLITDGNENEGVAGAAGGRSYRRAGAGRAGTSAAQDGSGRAARHRVHRGAFPGGYHGGFAECNYGDRGTCR